LYFLCDATKCHIIYFVNGSNGTLISESTIRLDGNTGREIVVKNPQGAIAHIRYTTIGKRTYLAVVVNNVNMDDNAPIITAFLDSFHINESTP